MPWDDLSSGQIVALLTDASVCAACIVRKVGIPSATVHESMSRIAELTPFTATVAVCGRCRRFAIVYRLGRPRY